MRKASVCFLKLIRISLVSVGCCTLAIAADAPTAADQNPREWIDPDTGHRVIRISTEPDSQSLYFHYNSYTPEGDKMVFSAPSGIWTVDLITLGQGTPKLEQLVDSNGTSINLLMTAYKSRDAYFIANNALYAVNVDTKAIRTLVIDNNAAGRIYGVNCDETIVGGMLPGLDPTGHVVHQTPKPILPQRERMFGDKIAAGIALTPDEEFAANKEDGLSARLADPASTGFLFTNLKTGTQTWTGFQFASIDHQQFCPTDPHLVLYAHEGSWHEVDRIWTVRTDGSDQRLMYKRQMDMEIVGHEFWSYDGKTIWFDMQTPRSKDFWIGGVNVATGKLTKYHIERDWWGVHFNVSRDNTLFASDGGDPTQVAFSQNDAWINLFRVQPDGRVTREKLVNMAKQNYVTGATRLGVAGGGIEPNVSITPDKKWVVFRANIQGAVQVYAAEIGGDPSKISKPEKFVAEK
ncbi:MAG TPA: oligogalacturonate lyase family protein [Opitutales bacterium]|jgi:oligogalacturonide lyase|nr:oligogalacturonate lyase family protein [Opitutales bacterium]